LKFSEITAQDGRLFLRGSADPGEQDSEKAVTIPDSLKHLLLRAYESVN
jgi:hypothetical protein